MSLNETNGFERDKTKRRIDAYRKARDAYLEANREWHDNHYKSGESWEGRRRKNASDARDYFEWRRDVLRDLERIDPTDIDREDGIIVK